MSRLTAGLESESAGGVDPLLEHGGVRVVHWQLRNGLDVVE